MYSTEQRDRSIFGNGSEPMGLLLVDRVVRRLPDLARVLARFPVAIAALVALTLYLVFDFHLAGGWSPEVRLVRIPSALAGAALLAVALTLAGEGHRWSAHATQAAALLGAGLVAFLIWLANALELSPTLLLAAIALAIGVAPFVGRRAMNGPYWQLNHMLVAAVLLALLASSLFAGGLSLIVETLRVLLGIETPARAHERIWTVAALLVGPIYALSLVPRRLDDTPALSGTETPADLASRAIAVLVRFLAVPLVLAYAAILHVAAAKVLVDGAMPSGRIGWMVLSFGTASALTALAAWPTRRRGGALVALFWRIWPWLLVVPLALFLVALGIRIDAYGWTGPRLLGGVAGIWLASLVVTQGVLPLVGRSESLPLVHGALAFLLAVVMLGPWGYVGLPVRSQVREVVQLLERAGAAHDGRLSLAAAARPRLSPTDRARLGSIVGWLADQNRLLALRAVFEGSEADPFRESPVLTGRSATAALAERISERLGLGRVSSQRRHVGFQASAPLLLETSRAGAVVAGPFTVGGFEHSTVRSAVGTPEALVVEVDRNGLTVTESTSGRRARIELGPLVAELAAVTSQRAGEPGPPREIVRASGDLVARVIVQSLYARDDGERVELTSISFWLLVEP